MRRSERERLLAACAARTFRGARSLLSVGTRVKLPDCAVTELARIDALGAGARDFEGALLAVGASTPLAANLQALCARLVDGASVLLMAPARVGAGARLSALVARTQVAEVALPPLCEALLLAGLSTPRVHAELPDTFLVSAALPARRDPLDVFFSQPEATSRR